MTYENFLIFMAGFFASSATISFVILAVNAIVGRKNTGRTVAMAEDDISEDDLPKFADLLGMAPNATGGMSSEAWVRKQRDDWR